MGKDGYPSKAKEPDLNNEQPYKEWCYSKPPNQKYADGIERIFGKKQPGKIEPKRTKYTVKKGKIVRSNEE